jgi:hypothetical protein
MLQMLLEGVPALDWRNGRFIDLGSPLVFVGHSDKYSLFVLNSSEDRFELWSRSCPMFGLAPSHDKCQLCDIAPPAFPSSVDRLTA